ncbi:MAG TPA: YeeE/YedE thiosulfate transporter family protein [Polyangiaceae bacterium]
MIPALLGGALIGLAASLFWALNGRIAGVSGVVHGALRLPDGHRGTRLAFLFGLVVAGYGFAQKTPLGAPGSSPLPVVLLAGLLVGFGARLGGGCTSGHGVCGLSRFSARSLVATLTFIATGIVTVLVVTRAFPALGVGP